jgi:hypothetical protein
MNDGALVPSRGEHFVAGPSLQVPAFGGATTRLHRPAYDDYETARRHIWQALGDISDFELFGRDTLVAVFCRPNMTPSGVIMPINEIKEDWWQGKGVMLVAHGPGAFNGDDSWVKSMYRNGKPQPGDFLIARSSDGTQLSVRGEGASRPQGVDRLGRTMDLFEWDGWPCRVMPDDRFFGRLSKLHMVI